MSKPEKPTYLLPVFISLAICIAGLAGAYIFPRLNSTSTLVSAPDLPPVDSPAPPTPSGPVNLTFSKPVSWKTINLPSLGISVCLPPTWSVKATDTIQGTVGAEKFPITKISTFTSTASGSLKSRYLEYKVGTIADPTTILPKSTVDEFYINSLPAIFVSLPGNPDVLVTARGNQLYEFAQQDLNPFADTLEEVYDHFYTMVSCVALLN